MRKKILGIGLTELMLSLTIIVMLTLMALRYFSYADQAKSVAKAVDIIEAIETAGQKWLLTHSDFSDTAGQSTLMAAFIDRGYLPADFSQLQSPWGGNISVNKSALGANKIVISVAGMPLKACRDLTVKMQDQEISGSSISKCTPGKTNTYTYTGHFLGTK